MVPVPLAGINQKSMDGSQQIEIIYLNNKDYLDYSENRINKERHI
jgi:hypothetical protein